MIDSWYVYILRCSDNSLYTGITMDIDRRLEEHNNDNVLGAKYTRARRPVTVVYLESTCSRSEAARRESAIKNLSRQEKERLVKNYSGKL